MTIDRMKRMPGKFYQLAVVAMLACRLNAQVYDTKFEHIGGQQGLSQSTVEAILQDSKGFLWFSTRNGLNQFNGYHFNIYKSDPTDSNSISDNWITSLAEDRYKNLWIGTFNRGVNCYDRIQGKFHRFIADPKSGRSLSNNSVTAITVDRSGNLWVGTKDGLNKLNLDSAMQGHSAHGFVVYAAKPGAAASLNSGWITALMESADGVLWVGTKEGLSCFVQGRLAELPPAFKPLASAAVSAMTVDVEGGFWIGTDGDGLYRYSASSGLKKISAGAGSIAHDRISALYSDSRGYVWVGTYDGLNHVHVKTGVITTFRHDPTDPNSLSDNEVRCIQGDRTGVLWVGTYGGGGLNKLDLKPIKFTHVKHEPGDPNSLSNNIVRSFLEDRDGILWIGTHEGLTRYDTGKNQFLRFLKTPGGLNHDEVRTLAEGEKGELFIGTEGGGINVMDLKSRQFRYLRHDPKNTSSLSHDDISVLYTDKDRNVWVGTFGGGLNRMVTENQFVHYRSVSSDPNSLSSDRVSSIYRDRQGALWVGTFAGGLNKLEFSKNLDAPPVVTHYRHMLRDSTTISSDVIYSIHEDASGHLWIGTNAGLNILTDEGKFLRLYEKDGLPDNYIYGILADEDGNVWLSTVQGLSKATPISGAGGRIERVDFRNYDEGDGLQANEFKFGAYYKSRHGELFFGGTNGFNRFFPRLAKDNPYIPPIAFTAFRKIAPDGKGFVQTETAAIYQLSEIRLRYDEDFSFEFAALDFTDPEKNVYAYKLEGFDKNWIYSATRRFVNYTNLDAGAYVFRVRGTNNDRVWNEQGIAIPIYIVPPFWKTWWFFSLCVLAMAGIVYGFIRYRLSHMEQQKNRLEVEVSNRTREIKAQRDELKTINTQLEDALQSLSETQSQLLHAEKMASLGQMVAGIAHEINNPLTVVDGNLHLLEENVHRWDTIIVEYEKLMESNDPAKIRKGVGEIRERHEYEYVREDTVKILDSCKKGSQRIKNIVQDLRKFSRIDASGLTPADIHEGIESTLSILKPQYDGRVEVLREYGSLPLVDCYPGLLNQVFMNIISNAVEAIPSEGKIWIRTGQENGHAVIRIKDNGIGMSPSVRKSIFDPFFTTKDIGKGMGLGLSISYGIIKKHSGDIEVESDEGKGSEFIIRIPMSKWVS